MCRQMLYSARLLRGKLQILLNWNFLWRIHYDWILSPEDPHSNRWWVRSIIICQPCWLQNRLLNSWNLSYKLKIWWVRSFLIGIELLLLLHHHRCTNTRCTQGRLGQHSLSGRVSTIWPLRCCTMTSCLTHTLSVVYKRAIVWIVRKLISCQNHLGSINLILLLDVPIRSL